MRTFHTGGVASAEDITQGLPASKSCSKAANRSIWPLSVRLAAG
ncbi:MAG: hypothetical protein ACLS8R_04195 [Anaeromassilibacillus sp.]